MPCEEEIPSWLAGHANHMTPGSVLDPKRFRWKVGCYIPKKTSWFWPESDDVSKSKCGCFLTDETMTAAATEETEPQMCTYTPMQVDSKAANMALDAAGNGEAA